MEASAEHTIMRIFGFVSIPTSYAKPNYKATLDKATLDIRCTSLRTANHHTGHLPLPTSQRALCPILPSAKDQRACRDEHNS